MLSPVRASGVTQALAGRRRPQALLGLALPLLACTGLFACKGEFEGPYPCELGYASCVSPERNLCETDTTTDAANCGACGQACGVGARCANSNCSAGAQKVASLAAGAVPRIAVNSTALYWASTGQSQIMRVPTAGGTPTVAAENLYTCGNNGLPFALSDSAFYYASNGVPCTSTNCTSNGLVAESVATGNQTTLFQVQQSQSISCPSGYAIDSSRLYWTENQNPSSLIVGLPLTGGTPTTLATVDTQNGSVGSDLTVTRTLLLFTSSQNGPWQMQSIPVTGTTKSPTTIPLLVDGQSFGFNSFVANDSFIFVASGGCPCEGNTGGVLPMGRVDRFALDGKDGVNVAQFAGLVNGMALDSDNLYFATESNLWEMPIKTGSARIIAGNLLGGATPTLCNFSCASQLVPTVSIAVDAQFVYVADGAPNVQAILKVHK